MFIYESINSTYFFLEITSSNVFASCSDILSQGIHDTKKYLNTRDTYKNVKSKLCSMNERTLNKFFSSNSSKSFGFSYDGVGINFGKKKGNSGNDVSMSKSEFCRSDYDSFRQLTNDDSLIQTVNQGLVDAWLECKDIENRLDNNVYHFIEPLDSPDRFIYRIIYNTDNYETQVVEWEPPVNAKCERTLSEGYKIKKFGFATSCTRNLHQETIIILNTKHGGKHLKTLRYPAASVINWSAPNEGGFLVPDFYAPVMVCFEETENSVDRVLIDASDEPNTNHVLYKGKCLRISPEQGHPRFTIEKPPGAQGVAHGYVY